MKKLFQLLLIGIIVLISIIFYVNYLKNDDQKKANELKKEQNFTLLWVTHEPGLMLSHLDQVIHLQDGQLTFDGLPEKANAEPTFQPYFQV